MDEISSKQHETHPDRKIILIFGKKKPRNTLNKLWLRLHSINHTPSSCIQHSMNNKQMVCPELPD